MKVTSDGSLACQTSDRASSLDAWTVLPRSPGGWVGQRQARPRRFFPDAMCIGRTGRYFVAAQEPLGRARTILIVLQACRRGVVGMAAMIERTCAAHLEPGPDGPLVTTVDGVWAYCFGGGDEGHDWGQIRPTALELLRAGMQAPAPQAAQ